jgi:hypothetical protein
MRIFAGLLLTALVILPGSARAELYYLIVAGLGGDPAYAERFADDAAAMVDAAERTLGTTERVQVLSGDLATLAAVRQSLSDLGAGTAPSDRLAVFLIGHGSYDGTEYKFNLIGEDITGTELNDLLAAVPAQSQLIVNMTSSSGAVLESWAGDGRELITATMASLPA